RRTIGVFARLLHAPELIGQLLIAELQLLDHAGHLPDLGFEAIDAHAEIAGGGLRDPVAPGRRGALAAEQPIKQARRFVSGSLRRRRGSAGQQGGGCHRYPKQAERHVGHEPMIWLRGCTIRIPASEL
ncbi:MAG TPA: hypothetical protein VIY51_05675, partial [Xanthobacteraceae bacterium]